MSPRLGSVLWYLGRFLQLFAMWILLVDIFMAGPMGPAPKPFYVGVVTFIVPPFTLNSPAPLIEGVPPVVSKACVPPIRFT